MHVHYTKFIILIAIFVTTVCEVNKLIYCAVLVLHIILRSYLNMCIHIYYMEYKTDIRSKGRTP